MGDPSAYSFVSVRVYGCYENCNDIEMPTVQV